MALEAVKSCPLTPQVPTKIEKFEFEAVSPAMSRSSSVTRYMHVNGYNFICIE